LALRCLTELLLLLLPCWFLCSMLGLLVYGCLRLEEFVRSTPV